jgi:hypothetical protein
MNELKQNIQSLNGPQVAEAVKNLSLALQYHWERQVGDDEVRETLQAATAEGDAEVLRSQIISEEQDAVAMERWGKSLLLYTAADPDLRPYVEEAVADAKNAVVKDFGLSSLIVIGVVLVLLKYRPKKFERTKEGTKIEWEDNDVSAVETLAKMTTGS